MLQQKVTMLIFSCDKFSDLWDGHVKLLEKNWSDRKMETYIVTDKETDKHYNSVKILCAGENAEFTDRVSYALSKVKTEYVFVTLDDYFLPKRINTKAIQNLVKIMDLENLDYLRLYLRSKRSNKEQIKNYKGICWVDTSCRYSVNLYPGIWKKDFMMKTAIERKNPWQYEVSLPRLARENNARCAMSYRKEFEILDVVRKGKILNRANRYLRKHNIYNGDRPVQSRWYEFKLCIQTMGSRLLPTWMFNKLRGFLIKRGHHFYSQDE